MILVGLLVMAIIHIGFDDIDSPFGGCTTDFVSKLVIEWYKRRYLEFIDYPNLIRLCPGVPWKTRGNGAVVLRLKVKDIDIGYKLFEEAVSNAYEYVSYFRHPESSPAIALYIGEVNDKLKWLEIGCCKIKYGGDAYLLNAVDITRRVEMEKEIREANEKMQRALEKEKKFLEEISHYFFNPLCIAKGYLDLSIPQADPALRRKLEITKQAVTRVENVVKHIVTEGKIYE